MTTFFVIGAYQPAGAHDECTRAEDRPRALNHGGSEGLAEAVAGESDCDLSGFQPSRNDPNQINTKTGHYLKQQMVDEQTGRVVDKEHESRGYEHSKGRYVELDEEELDAVKLESTHTIEIDDFVPAEDIDERYLDKPYYIVPIGTAGADAFVVIPDAMKRKDKIALARVVLSNRSTSSC